MKWKEFFQKLEKEKPRPFYLFYGDEELLVAEALSKLKERVIPPALSDWNYQTFHADEADPEDILVAARTLPVFSSLRLVVVKDCQRLKVAAQRAILSYLTEPCPSSCLVCLMSQTTVKAREIEKEESEAEESGKGKTASTREFLEAFRKQGAVVEFSQPFENELQAWVKRLAASMGRRIEPEAVRDLIQACDKDLLAIKNELTKLDISLAPGEAISAKAAEELAFPGLVENIFALCDAIGEKNVREAWALLDQLLLLPPKKAAPAMLLVRITGHLRKIMRAKEMLKQGQRKETIAAALRVFKHQDRFFRQVEGFSREELQKNFSRLLEWDLTLKTSSLPPKIHLERVILGLSAQASL